MATGERINETISPDNIGDKIREIEKRDSVTAAEPVEAKGAAAPGAPPVAAAPAADTQTPVETDWTVTGLQVDHGMLKGKRPDEVVRIVQSAQAKIRTQGEELALLRSRANQPVTYSAKAEADRIVDAAPQDDPRVLEYETAVFTNPRRALEIATEIAEERYEQRRTAERTRDEFQSQSDSAIGAGKSAAAKITESYGVDAPTLLRNMKHVAFEVKERADKVFADFGDTSHDPSLANEAANAWREVWKSEDTYLNVYRDLFGDPTNGGEPREVITAPVVAPRADPYGAKPAAPTPLRAAVVTKQLDPETERAIERLGGGLSREGLARINKRVAARG